MNKEILKGALTVEQLEDRFEMTAGALDGCRCVVGDCYDVDPTEGGGTDTGGSTGTGGNTGGGGGGGTDPLFPDAL